MKEKDFLIKINDENYNNLKNSDTYKEYISYLKLISKLEKMVSDFSIIEQLNDDDVKVLDTVIPNASALISRLKLYNSKYKQNLSPKDLQNMVNTLSKDINDKILSSDIFIKLHNLINYYYNIKEIIENDEIKENYIHIIDFIVEDCFKKGKISAEEAVKLNLFIANYCTSVSEKNNEIEEDELEENIESIYDKLVEIFKKYGYDFEKLEEETKDKLNKYVKINYVEYILSALKEHNIDSKALIKNQKEI